MKFLLIYFAYFSTDGGLVTQPKVMEYLATLKEPAQILEVGCGTGAGANEITKVHPTAEVTALDMQKAAIQTCKRLHADGNPRLTCIHGNGMETGFPSNKYDIIVVSETHIAAEDLTPRQSGSSRKSSACSSPVVSLYGAMPCRLGCG